MPKFSLAIVVLPGIGGSNVKDPNNAFEGFGADMIFRLVCSNLARPAYQSGRAYKKADDWEVRTGSGGPIGRFHDQDKIDRGWYGVAGDVYWPFLEDCAAHSFGSLAVDVFAVGYNFWHRNAMSATDILPRIKSIAAGYTKFLIISHSMGGLVGLHLLHAIKTTQKALWSKLFGFVPVASPFHGAPELTFRFKSGMSVLDEGVAAYVLGSTGYSFSLQMAKMPGIYELLPDRALYDPSGNALDVEDYVEHSVRPIIPQPGSAAQVARYKQLAKKYRLQAEAMMTARHMMLQDTAIQNKIVPVVLGNVSTAVGFNGAGFGITKIPTMQGDGTVPATSQIGGLPHFRTVLGLRHAEPFGAQGAASWPEIYGAIDDLKQRL